MRTGGALRTLLATVAGRTLLAVWTGRAVRAALAGDAGHAALPLRTLWTMLTARAWLARGAARPRRAVESLVARQAALSDGTGLATNRSSGRAGLAAFTGFSSGADFPLEPALAESAGITLLAPHRLPWITLLAFRTSGHRGDPGVHAGVDRDFRLRHEALNSLNHILPQGF